MILCLDVGNSQIYGGIFDKEEIILRFRHNTTSSVSSDQFGLFLRNVIKENNVDPLAIKDIAICTVVPQLLYTLKSACKKYFEINPFVLGPGEKTGLKIKYRNPAEVGADRIANAIAIRELYPNRHAIIVDFGTATTFCAVTADRSYLGGVILPGMRLAMESLEQKTAKLPTVEIIHPKSVVGRSTVESIQSGLFYSHLYAVKGIVSQINVEHFQDAPALVIGTGGFAHLFSKEEIFDVIENDLVLKGLYFAQSDRL